MSPRGSPTHSAIVVALLLSFIRPAAAQTSAAAPRPPGSPAIGAKLFSGSIRFANGGPPCASCHTAAGIAFPNGGTLGPDLTTASARFGPAGMQMFVSTLFFPTMNPLFQGRLLTAAEQADLLAFFDQSSRGAAAPNVGWIFGAAGVLLAVALFIVTALTWRHRLRRVRHHLVAKSIGVPRP